MTTRTRPLPPHGTLSRHKYHKCKCDTCYEGYRKYQRARHRRKGYGTWQPFVDAEPIRQHLLMLREHGIAFTKVAEVTGLYPATVGGFLYSVGASRPRKERARPDIAAKILAVTPESVTPGAVDATGTRRRLQALAANGWPMKALAPHIGVAPATVSRLTTQQRVYSRTAEAVTKCYDQLADQSPEDHGIPAAVVIKTRNRAAANKWPDPLWWEDMGGIDDPQAPEQDTPTPQHVVIGENALELEAQGYTRRHAAERLGISLSTLETNIRRYRQSLGQAA
ncbi:helix-turn-helix domain-containing protein [Streptomyces sparsogenes]|uniref:helix-turn-helix domain-containing protein n=1 Tax=Streptomyces sparsogenes TaxID=67365 RepID=UPI0033DE1787